MGSIEQSSLTLLLALYASTAAHQESLMRSPILVSVLALSVVSACSYEDKFYVTDDTKRLELITDTDADGYAEDEDCDDNNYFIHPGADEICDGSDNNCDGSIDEEVSITFYADHDVDGFGDEGSFIEACEQPDGYVPIGNDCDDSRAEVYPAAPEACDGIDNDCDGEVDDGLLEDWYADGDGDGYGDPDSGIEICQPMLGYVDNSDDCDDTNSDALPGGLEVCDEVDNDCNGETDEGVTITFYMDIDGDGYGIAAHTTESCDRPTGYADVPGDCDDDYRHVNPDAEEVCDDIDNDCDNGIDEGVTRTFYKDGDIDGYGDADAAIEACYMPSGYVTDLTDCDDGDDDVYPGAAEDCDGLDNDCDGSIDEGVTTAYYEDSDHDGFGDADVTTESCVSVYGYVANDRDCDDSDYFIHPDAQEICNEVDDDCDGDIDGDDDSLDRLGMDTFYADSDGDGYGDGSDDIEACYMPSGYVADDSDCDDDDAFVNPGEYEECNGVDDDCDGTRDDSTVCPCSLEYNDDSLYLFCESSESWSDAQAECSSHDYHLLTVSSSAEDAWVDAVADSYSTGKWWIGFTDIASEGSFAWEDGSATTYTNWAEGEPNNVDGDEDCAVLNRFTDQTWNDEKCSDSFYYICEAD